jgi:hypothetical protein
MHARTLQVCARCAETRVWAWHQRECSLYKGLPDAAKRGDTSIIRFRKECVYCHVCMYALVCFHACPCLSCHACPCLSCHACPCLSCHACPCLSCHACPCLSWYARQRIHMQKHCWLYVAYFHTSMRSCAVSSQFVVHKLLIYIHIHLILIMLYNCMPGASVSTMYVCMHVCMHVCMYVCYVCI